MTLFEELKWRGLVKDVANEEELEKKVNAGKMVFYWGTDPTADSLHVGHYSSLVTAKRLAKAGNQFITLVGGSTGMIGDPRPTAEREIAAKETIIANAEKLKKQIQRLVDKDTKFVNNYDWTKDVGILDFLRDVGKYVNLNYMLDKDIIRRRLDTGITYAEFSYTLLQAFDFLWLYKNMDCEMQIGGSDQWGNLTSGVDLINKKLDKEAYAFTMPLILDANGNKFGKSEGNALWLDEDKTSSYELYQYLINSSDEKIEEYLKVFTFLTPEEIEDVMKKHLAKPEDRLAQKTLAFEMIKDLHGEESFNHAMEVSEALFSGDVSKLNEKDITSVFRGMDSFDINKDTNIVDLLVDNEVVKSKREAREFISNGSITLNGEKVTDTEMVVTKKDCLFDKYLIIRRGKKKYHVGMYN